MKIKTPKQYAIQVTQLSSLCSLNFDQLIVLNLSNLGLTKFPTEIQSNQLETLIIDNNHFRSFSHCDLFPNLNYLSIKNNKLVEFHNPKSLKHLNIKSNELTEIKIKNLQSIDIQSNPIRTIIIPKNNNIRYAAIGWLELLEYLPKFQKELIEDSAINLCNQWETLTIRQSYGQLRFQDFLKKALNLLYEFGDLEPDQRETENSDRNPIRDDSDLARHLKQNILIHCIKNNEKHLFDLLLPIMINVKLEETPLSYAIKKGKVEFISKLMNQIKISQESDAFHQAIIQGQISLVKQFLDIGISPNVFSSKGYTPITTAVINVTQINMVSIISLLLLSGSKPNLHNKNGLTAFQMCVIKSNLSALKFIIAHNMNCSINKDYHFKMNLKSQRGDYPLHLAIHSVSILKFLLEHQIGNVFCVNYNNLGIEELATNKQEENLIIIKMIRRAKGQKVYEQLMLKQSEEVKQDDTFDHQDLLNISINDSSCPDVSEDEDDSPNKPKIIEEKHEITSECRFALFEQSEEDSDLDYLEDFTIQSMPISQGIDFNNLNERNRISKKLQNGWSKIRQISQMIFEFYKKRLNQKDLNCLLIKLPKKPKQQQIQKIIRLRQEFEIYRQMLEFESVIDNSSLFQLLDICNMKEYLRILKEQIEYLENESMDQLMNQYNQLQRF